MSPRRIHLRHAAPCHAAHLSTTAAAAAAAAASAAATATATSLSWDDDDFYGPERLRVQLQPVASGTADITLLEHTLTYFMKDNVLAAAHTSFGPHFGTLSYKRSLYVDDGTSKILSKATCHQKTSVPRSDYPRRSTTTGIRFPDASEAEDYAFAQHAVEDAGATLMVVVDESDAAAEEEDPATFVCVRHGSNTWTWNDAETKRKYGNSATVISSSARLDPMDASFAEWMRTSGALADVASRRSLAPAKNRRVRPPVHACLTRKVTCT